MDDLCFGGGGVSVSLKTPEDSVLSRSLNPVPSHHKGAEVLIAQSSFLHHQEY